jgi:hypothetical protein
METPIEINQEAEKRFRTVLQLAAVLEQHGATPTCLNWAHNCTKRLAETIAGVGRQDESTWGMVQDVLEVTAELAQRDAQQVAS